MALRLRGQSATSGVVFAAGNRIQVDLLPVAAFNSGANLVRSPAFARHLIRVIAFFGAGSAFGAMQVFKTTAQTGMADGPVAATIAGQLIQDTGNLGSILIDLHLPGQLKIDAGQLFAVQNRRQLCVCWWWRAWNAGRSTVGSVHSAWPATQISATIRVNQTRLRIDIPSPKSISEIVRFFR